MAEPLVRNESPVEYFRELVDSAIQRQHVGAGELTSFYLVRLLTSFIHSDRAAGAGGDEPLGVRFVKALGTGGARQRDQLRQVGDQSLFISGFFSDSLKRSAVDIDYYIQLGEHAYGSLAQRDQGTFADVFDELAGKFPSFVDVLCEVSERTAVATNSDLLRLYERWLRTGSRHCGSLLVERGIVPNASIGDRFIQ